MASAANAHFVWIVVEPDREGAVANVYLSESAAPDDPEYLAKLKNAQVYVPAMPHGREKPGDPTKLELKLADGSLTAVIPAEQRGNPVVIRQTYGVMDRGKEKMLLQYYGKAYPSALPGTWRAVNNAEILPFEITPKATGNKIVLSVLWLGKPAADATVTIVGPGIKEKVEGATDSDGKFTFEPPQSGLFSVRAKRAETAAGKHEGADYTSVRYYTTLPLPVSLQQVATAPNSWPKLTKGITSFGAAVDGDWLYVYGGHFGAPHHYYTEGQSGDFARLNLRNPEKWESLPGGPRLTGLALVAHDGKLYRIGGFAAKNAEKAEQDLWSQAEFAVYDPKTNAWAALPSLPVGRSSFDAAVIGNKIYVVGGWNLQGDADTQWQDSALSFDLSSEKKNWQEIAKPPFHRRALSLAACNGKLYVVGGMTKEGGPTTKTAIYDPATNQWSDGPNIMGSAMDGFGSSAFACNGQLFVTTMSGSIQRLSSADDRWEYVGQLDHPRFFHRLLSWNNQQLTAVGGASMMTGKIAELESVPVVGSATKTPTPAATAND